MWLRGNRKKLTAKEAIRTIMSTLRLVLLPVFVVALFPLLIFGAIHGYRNIKSSGYFLLKNIVIEGNEGLDREEVIALCGLHPGKDNTVFLKAEEVQAMCERDSRIRMAKVQIEVPDTVYIRVQVRQPVFYLANQFGLYEVSQFGEVIRPVPLEDLKPMSVLVLNQKVSPEDVTLATSGMLQLLKLLRDHPIPGTEEPITVEFTKAKGFVILSGLKVHLGYPPFHAKIERVAQILEVTAKENLVVEEIYVSKSTNPKRAIVRFSQHENPVLRDQLDRLSARKEGL